jgi:predicted transcriptional regulator of viral defense system
MYILFKNYFESKPIISLIEIYKAFPNFDRRRLVEWQKKGYIEKIRQGFYRFTSKEIQEITLNYYANKIYAPSYISMETALSYYQIIPEGVFSITNITTLNTSKFQTSVGTFTYKHVKPELFFGYRFVTINKINFSIANPEKAILDYLYFHNEIHLITDFESLRWDKEALKTLDFDKFSSYLQLFHSKRLTKRYQLLLDYLHA